MVQYGYSKSCNMRIEIFLNIAASNCYERVKQVLFTSELHEVPNLEKMMDDYGNDLLRLCYMYLKDYQLAEDALQDTFIKVYTKYASFKKQSSEKTWITSIAMNVCKDYMRKKSFSEQADDFSTFIPVDESASPETLALQSVENAQVLKAVLALPDIYRQTILLYYYSGFSTVEISKILKTAKPTVNVRLKRARDMLKASLEGVYADETPK